MDQATAEKALKEMARLVGEWTLEAIGPGGERWPGEARATIEWHDSRAHLVQRSTGELPEAPNTVSIITGCRDVARNGSASLISVRRRQCPTIAWTAHGDELRSRSVASSW
jgi:hypothetical protein